MLLLDWGKKKKEEDVEERHKKRRKKRDPVCSEAVMLLGDVAWPGIIKHLDSIRSLIVLGLTSKSLYTSIWNNHELMCILYQQYWMWNPAACKQLNPRLHSAFEPDFAPLVSWSTDGVPPKDRDAFNRHVRKLCVLKFAPWCSMCHCTSRHQAAVLILWTLGLRVCLTCMNQYMISSKVLFHRYGICLTDKVKKKKKKLLDYLIQKRVFYVTVSTGSKERELYSATPLDFVGVSSVQRVDMIFFWLPSLRKVICLDKAYRYMQKKKRAVEEHIDPFFRRALVQNIRAKLNVDSFKELRENKNQIGVRYLGKVKAFVLKGLGCLRKKFSEVQEYFFLGWSLSFTEFFRASDHQCLSNMSS